MPLRAALVVLLLALSPAAAAVPTIGVRESLRFDRPEAWAMAFMGSALLFHGTGPLDPSGPGGLTVGAELASVPHLSQERRRVGFSGSKLEDLNKSPVVGRLRARLGLGEAFAVELGWTPPLTIDGATAERMVGVALEARVLQRGSWRAALRLAHQSGAVRGDISCNRATAAFAPGSADNPFGCRAPSRDRYSMRATGLEASASWRRGADGIEPWAALAWHRLDARTRLDARVFGVRDRSLLLTEGHLATAMLGLTVSPRPGWLASAALAWTPLQVRRPQRGRESDDFWSLRLVLQRRLR